MAKLLAPVNVKLLELIPKLPVTSKHWETVRYLSSVREVQFVLLFKYSSAENYYQIYPLFQADTFLPVQIIWALGLRDSNSYWKHWAYWLEF